MYWPLLIHRLIGNVSWTALFCAAYAALRMRGGRGDHEERAFQSWAARVNLRVGLLAGLLMPVVGFALVEVIKQSEPGYFDNLLSGGTAAFMVAQECLVGVMFIGGNIALASEDGGPREWSWLSRAAIVVSLAGMTWQRCRARSSVTASTRFATGASARPPSSPPSTPWPGCAAAACARTTRCVSPAPSSRVGPQRASSRWAPWPSMTSLLMGYIKEHARGDYAVYGELRQVDAHQPYQPSQSLYP